MKRAHEALLRVQLAQDSLATFVEQYAGHAVPGGIFIGSRNAYPIGSGVRFELALRDGRPALRGEGRVVWVREYDPAKRSAQHGVGVTIRRLDGASQSVFQTLLDRRQRGVRAPAVEAESLEALMLEHGVDELAAEGGAARLRLAGAGLGEEALPALARRERRARETLGVDELVRRLEALVAPSVSTTVAVEAPGPQDTQVAAPMLTPRLTPMPTGIDLGEDLLALEAAPENRRMLRLPGDDAPTIQASSAEEPTDAVREFERSPPATIFDPREASDDESDAAPATSAVPTLLPADDEDITSPQDVLPELQPEQPGAPSDSDRPGFFRRLFGAKRKD